MGTHEFNPKSLNLLRVPPRPDLAQEAQRLLVLLDGAQLQQRHAVLQRLAPEPGDSVGDFVALDVLGCEQLVPVSVCGNLDALQLYVKLKIFRNKYRSQRRGKGGGGSVQ